jgi:hypothetical protein
VETYPGAARDRERLRTGPLAPVLEDLRRGLWHTTTLKGYAGIRASGAIEPNRGQFPFNFIDTPTSYAFFKGYVSLFDFASATEDQCAMHYPAWAQYFEGFRVAIEIVREDVAAGLIGYERARADAGSRMLIPHVEAWHDGAIPISATRRYLFITPRYEFGWLDRDDPKHDALIAQLRLTPLVG